MRSSKVKVLLICIGSALAVALITGLLALVGFTGPVKFVLGTVSKPFQYIGKWASDGVNGFLEVFTDYDDLKAENERLRAELSEKKEEAHDYEVLKEENAWLKEYIGFAVDSPNFSLAEATVISREAGNHTEILTLNRGSVHGVKTNMPVITADGVYGNVVEVGLDWCRVTSIISPDTSVGAAVKRSGAKGVIAGSLALSAEGYCTMTYIESTADIKIGDRIYTSGGAGSSYPAGLYLGEVVRLDSDESTRTLSAKIKPAVDHTNTASLTKLAVVIGYGETKK